jgi:hypothetical protein
MMFSNTMANLRERFESFVQTLDGFESIDVLLKEAYPHGIKRAVYLLQNRRIVIEQKVLQSNPDGRPQRFADKVARERGIIYYGATSTARLFGRQPDSQELQKRLILDLARVIDDDVACADKQTADTRQLFNIPTAMGVIVLLNEGAKMLRPDVIHYALANSFQKKSGTGGLRYVANDGVIVISEALCIELPSFPRAFPLLSFHAPLRRQAAPFTAFSDSLMKHWAAFNNAPLVMMPANGI